jgi:hypothetical protein
MYDETNFLNELKMYILNSKNDYESNIIELFINTIIKCISINEVRNLIDTSIDTLKTRNQYNEHTFSFFCKVKKKIAFYDLRQIYDNKTLAAIETYNTLQF